LKHRGKEETEEDGAKVITGFEYHGPIAMIIKRSSGELVFCGISQTASGTEIIQVDTCCNFKWERKLS
jgi:hypothetical protein